MRGAVTRCRCASVLAVGGDACAAALGREEPVELGRRRHRRRAAMARHDDRAAGVGGARSTRRSPRRAASPTESPAANASPAPSTFSTSTRTPRTVSASSSDAGTAPSTIAQPSGAALDHQRRRRHRAHAAQRRRSGRPHAAGDPELLLGADQQVELRQDLLQVRGDARRSRRSGSRRRRAW